MWTILIFVFWQNSVAVHEFGTYHDQDDCLDVKEEVAQMFGSRDRVYMECLNVTNPF
jgi:hypothetical protein